MKIKIEYPLKTSFVLTIERDHLPDDPSELLNSVTRSELANGYIFDNKIEWCDCNEAWRSSNAEDTYFYDEDYNELYTLIENDKEERNRS